MPSELLLTSGTNIKNNENISKNDNEKATISIEESDLLVALRVEADEEKWFDEVLKYENEVLSKRY